MRSISGSQFRQYSKDLEQIENLIDTQQTEEAESIALPKKSIYNPKKVIKTPPVVVRRRMI